MAIKVIEEKYSGLPIGNRKEFICDTDADVSTLPACAPGSTALVAASGKIHIVNASGQWVEFGEEG